MLWEGFYYDFSTKKASASGGFAPWTPARGRCPLDPRGNFAPSNDLPWRRPWFLSQLGVIQNEFCLWITVAVCNSYVSRCCHIEFGFTAASSEKRRTRRGFFFFFFFFFFWKITCSQSAPASEGSSLLDYFWLKFQGDLHWIMEKSGFKMETFREAKSAKRIQEIICFF